MELADLTRALDRAPWNGVARHILSRASYDTTRGFPKTVASVLAERADPAKIEALATGLTEHLVAGEKLIQLVKVSAAERKALEGWIRSKRIHKNDLTDAFPGVAPEATIVPLRALDPTSAGFVELENGIAALFTAVRSYVKSEPVPASSLKASAAGGFERLVGYRRFHLQTFDAIWLPEGRPEYVVLAVDYPTKVPRKDFPEPGMAFLNFTLRQQLRRQLKVANFWHAIDGLYEGTEGKLVDYGFSAGGQSVNHHRARRKTSVCLRKAIYDAAGAAAVKAAGSELELFKAAIQWSYKHDDDIVTEPEVMIAGMAADLNKPMPVVNHCIVRNCLSTSDLNFVVSKLEPLITTWS